MNEPIRPDKDDRYCPDKDKKASLSPKRNKNLLSKKQWIILILALIILFLLLSFAMFKPNSSDQQQLTNDPQSSVNNPTNPEYQTLIPPSISRNATTTQQDITQDKERIEISGEVTDILTNKIAEITEKDKVNGAIMFEGQNSGTNKAANELPLTKILENAHYTIQITSSSSFENILAFVKQYKLTNYQIYETKREQKPWFVLIKGNYATNNDAKNAIKSLPQDLQKSAPWIKSGELVNKEKLPE